MAERCSPVTFQVVPPFSKQQHCSLGTLHLTCQVTAHQLFETQIVARHCSEKSRHNAIRRTKSVIHVGHCLLLLLTDFLFCPPLFLSVTMAIVTRLPLRVLRSSSAHCSPKLRKFSTSLGPFTRAGTASPSPPKGLGVFMKLLNEAETGHLCSDTDDHACHWHGQTNWHFGANYADFTPAKV